MKFRDFDAGYIEKLRAGDAATQEHFVGYFTDLLHLKLRPRLRSPQAIEDVRQETFARVLKSLKKDNTLRQPERLGSFVNSVCNNVLSEHYRSANRVKPLDPESFTDGAAGGSDVLEMIVTEELRKKVHEILIKMPVRDRDLLKAVFLDEKDREEVCRRLGVDREYLRVLLFRARQEFKAAYLNQMNAVARRKPDA
ncbi:MAG TPA: sigma-70 family RNA polymerase sigma factor [Terracidiphilus sp.]|nr:sigma-70 family RNA polymerase sigma factor [Terracidiphilus sp.]